MVFHKSSPLDKGLSGWSDMTAAIQNIKRIILFNSLTVNIVNKKIRVIDIHNTEPTRL